MAGSDFTPRNPSRVVFAIGDVQPRRGVPYEIQITNDEIEEDPEYFEVHFVFDSQTESGGYAFPSAIARVTILDDDRMGGTHACI